jgi:hypothetical protein
MRLSPTLEIRVAAVGGAAATALADVAINGTASGAGKIIDIASGAAGAPLFGMIAIIAAGALGSLFLRPLTRRSAFAAGVGVTAVLCVFAPPASVESLI